MDDFYSGLRCTAVFFCRRLFLAGDFSRPGEVTAAPGKPIAPSGEPGDKLMPLLKSVAHHLREILS